MKMINRRNLIKASAVASAPMIIPAKVLGEKAPSNRITIGCIGMGAQGTLYNMKPFITHDDCQVVTVCDARINAAKWAQGIAHEMYGNTDVKTEQDFRNVLADPSIDAVCISTPDHWHVPMSLMALKAGKHVICEKPTQSIAEGRVLADAFANSGKVFQAAIEDRSTIHFHKMVEWVKNGAIGELERVNVMMPQGKVWEKEEPAPVPAEIDWNLWQGPAEFHEYTPNRWKNGHWRHIGMYSKGAITDIGTHLVDTAQLAVNDPDVCPVEVSGTGLIPENKMTDVPVTFDLNYKYGNGVEMRVYNGPAQGWDPKSCQLEFFGSKGWIKRLEFYGGIAASDKEILRTKYTPETTRHWKFPPREHRDFLDAIKSGSQPIYPAIDLHQMTTTLLMGVHCIELGRPLKWDPKKEEFIDDAEANAKRFRPKARDWENA